MSIKGSRVHPRDDAEILREVLERSEALDREHERRQAERESARQNNKSEYNFCPYCGHKL